MMMSLMRLRLLASILAINSFSMNCLWKTLKGMIKRRKNLKKVSANMTLPLIRDKLRDLFQKET